MMTEPSFPPTPVRITPSFRKQGRRAPVVLQARNTAAATSPLTLRRLRTPSIERRKAVRNRLGIRRSAATASNAVSGPPPAQPADNVTSRLPIAAALLTALLAIAAVVYVARRGNDD